MGGKRGIPIGVQAFFAAFSVMLILGTAVHASPLGGLYLEWGPRPILKSFEAATPVIPLLGYVLFAAALSLLLRRLGIGGPVAGFKAGVLFGLTVTFPGYLLLLGTWDIAPALILLDSVLRMLEMGLAGAAAGFMLGFGAAVAEPDPEAGRDAMS